MKYLFTSNRCPHCKAAKKKFKKQLQKGEIKEMSADTDKGFKLAEKLGIRAIPTLVECDDKLKRCKVLY